jgi:hypothetical protein
MSQTNALPEMTLQDALDVMAHLNRQSLADEIEIGALMSQVSELREVLSFEQAQGRLMRDTLEHMIDPRRPARPDDGDAFRRLASSVLQSLERGRDFYVPDRGPEFKDGARHALRRCIAWLHARAASMNDPRARDVLNSAAFGMGCWKNAAVEEMVEDPPIPKDDLRR